MNAELTEQDLREVYSEIEKAISRVRTDSHMKDVKFQHFLNESDMQTFTKLYYIITGDIRKEIEKFFDKQIDGYYKRLAEEIQEKKKRGPKTAIPKPVKTGEAIKVGSLSIK